MPEFKSVVKKRLKVLMAEEDLNAEQLAAKSGVCVDSVRQYLRGETVPLLETACKLSEALNCTPNDLCAFPKENEAETA